jgi:hypothetical protein
LLRGGTYSRLYKLQFGDGDEAVMQAAVTVPDVEGIA